MHKLLTRALGRKCSLFIRDFLLGLKVFWKPIALHLIGEKKFLKPGRKDIRINPFLIQNLRLLAGIFFLFLPLTDLLADVDELSACKDISSPNSAPPLTRLESEPSSFVHNCVNVITGEFCDGNADLVVYHGVDTLTLERHYLGRVKAGLYRGREKIGAGWSLNQNTFLEEVIDGSSKKRIVFRFIDQRGQYLDLERVSHIKHAKCYKLVEKLADVGLTNTGQGVLSGQTNLKNLTVRENSKKDHQVVLGDGSLKTYNRLDTCSYIMFFDEFYHSLVREDLKPSKNALVYETDGVLLRSIFIRNRRNQQRGMLSFATGWDSKISSEEEKTVTTHDGRWVKYQYKQVGKCGPLLSCVIKSDAPSISYGYREFFSDPTNAAGAHCYVSAKALPDYRVLDIDYYDIGFNQTMGGNIHLPDRSDPRKERVKRLLAPVGTDTRPVPIYDFVHHVNDDPKKGMLGGSCDVYDALSNKTSYFYNDDQRLIEIRKFHQDGTVYTREHLKWGRNRTSDSTCLLSRVLLMGGKTVFAKKYQYDDAGNVIEEALHGNLSGEEVILHEKVKRGILSKKDKANSSSERTECYKIHRSFSQNSFNLLLQENDGTLVTKCEYKANTNLLTAKFQGTKEKIHRRWFYTYNDDAAVIKIIEDDGSSKNPDDLADVTERHITYCKQSETYPTAFPLVIEKKCLDLVTGKELLVHKTVNTYTNLARISKQEHYDSEGKHAYTLLWEYDNMGNVTKEVDALGRTITRDYDANGNCIFEQGPRTDCHKEFTYDFANRLIKETEVHSDGIHRTVSHRYDFCSNRIATVDQNGNETQYRYDPFGRVIEEIYPSMLADKGACSPSVKKEYDVMGKVTKEIDPNGNEKRMRYTIRGQLAEVAYPDGTTEKNTYNLNGTLKEFKAKNGTVTRYAYDPFGRAILTEIYASDHTLISATHAAYSGFHLMTETDPMGTETKYTYYPDGKLKSKQKGTAMATYAYDTLGRLHKTTEHAGADPSDVIVKVKEYDLLDRVIEERTEDSQGKVAERTSYAYDVAGNLHQVKHDTESGMSISTTLYDSHGVPTTVVDAEGNKTMTCIHYDYCNSLGQHVLCKEVTDPLGNVTTTILDALGHTVSITKRNAFGKITQKHEQSYDLAGNLCMIKDTIISSDEKDREIVSLMEYDTSNRLVACYEAVGTPEQKQMKITYNAVGQKQNLIKNDGVVLSHTYDLMGRLESLQSSDGTVHYVYHYDLNGNPLEVEDRVNCQKTSRCYDHYNLMTHETLGNELFLDYEYDRLGRPVEVILPDRTGIAFSYRSALIDSIHRLDAKKDIVYTHRYNAYDLSGHILEATLPQNSGSIHYRYDLVGRVKQIAASSWQEDICYDAVGNILKVKLKDNEEASSQYSYDDLYQLIAEKGEATHEYNYDSHYNRRSKDGRYHRLNALHQLLDDGIYRYTYDQNGNLQQKQSERYQANYTYDALDRLIAFCDGSQKVAYAYDENNRRLSKTLFTMTSEGKWTQVKKERYFYHGQNEIGAVNESGFIVELRLLGIGKGAEIGAAIALELHDKIYVPLHDHNGNLSGLVDGSTGELVERYRYTAYGEELFEEAISPWRFSSKRYDSETGFIYFGRRYYDAETGRWVTPDPIGRQGGPNLYAYVLNSPLTHFDLYGLWGMGSNGADFFCALGNFFKDCFSQVIKGIGACIECVSYHLIPVPGVKKIGEFAGHLLQGKSPSEFKWRPDPSQMVYYEGDGQRTSEAPHTIVSGICTSIHEMTDRMVKYSQQRGGVPVYGFCHSSDGAVLDVISTLFQKLGIPTEAQKVAQQEFRRIYDGMQSYKEDAIFTVEAHSRGAETVHNLSRDLKETMIVKAFAPARILRPNECREATNVFCGFDSVPMLADPVGFAKGIINGNIHFLPTTGCPIMDHFWDARPFERLRMRAVHSMR